MEGLTRNQEKFAGAFARETGLDAHVVGAWLKAEQSGSAARNYEGKGYNNWLNIANTDSGPAGGAHSSVWRDPEQAARASAEWIKGQGQIAHEYGKPASGIMAILHTAGQGPENQIKAIAGSGWASSGYEGGNTLRSIYHELSGQQLKLLGAAQRAAGLKAGIAPVVPEASTTGRPATPAAPNPIDAITAIHNPGTIEPGSTQATIAHNWELLKGLFAPEPDANGTPPTLHLPEEEPKVGGVGVQGGTAARALAWATGHLGKFVESQGNNLGPELNQLEKQFGMTGEPWCAIFATTVTSQGGASGAGRTASVAQINEWAEQGSHGYTKGLKPSSQARPGDLLTFGSEHVAVVKEVKGGTIVTIEGNANGSGGVVQLTHRVGEGQIARPVYHRGK